jgi:ribosomal protein L33
MVRLIPPSALAPAVSTSAGSQFTSINSTSLIVNPTISDSATSKNSPLTVSFTQAPIVAVSTTQNKVTKIALPKPTTNTTDKQIQGQKKTLLPADTAPPKSKTARGGVPQYIPPNPPPGLKIPGKWRVNHTFLCRECGDVFLFRSSLRQHLERRSMLVNYFCTPCNKKLAFVNK